MAAKNLIPYSVYLPEPLFLKLKEAAQQRKASKIIRDAIAMLIEGSDEYTSGYNKALKDATQVVYNCEEAKMISIKGKNLCETLLDRIDDLEIKVK